MKAHRFVSNCSLTSREIAGYSEPLQREFTVTLNLDRLV